MPRALQNIKNSAYIMRLVTKMLMMYFCCAYSSILELFAKVV